MLQFNKCLSFSDKTSWCIAVLTKATDFEIDKRLGFARRGADTQTHHDEEGACQVVAGPPLAGFEILVGKLQRSLPRFLRVYLRRFHSLDLLAYLKPPPPDLLTLVRSLSLFREGLISLLSRVQCGKWTEFAKLRDPGSGEWPSTTVLVACPGWSAGVRTNTIQGATEKRGCGSQVLTKNPSRSWRVHYRYLAMRGRLSSSRGYPCRNLWSGRHCGLFLTVIPP